MFDVANLLVALLVPFLSVFAAQQLTRRDTKRRATVEAFVQLNRHVQEFVYTFMELRRTDNFSEAQTMRGNPLPDDFHQVRHDQCRTLRSSVINLENDCMVLGLEFGQNADPLGSKVRIFGSRAALLLEATPLKLPSPDECFQLLERDSKEIANEIKLLWQSGVVSRRICD